MPDFSGRIRRLTSDLRRRLSGDVELKPTHSIPTKYAIYEYFGVSGPGDPENPLPLYQTYSEAPESPLSDSSFEPEIERDDPPGPSTLITHSPGSTRVYEGHESLTVLRGKNQGWAEAQIENFERAGTSALDAEPRNDPEDSWFRRELDLSADKSALARVPTEVLVMISDYLSEEDAASFTLTSRTVARRIGRHVWSHINTEKEVAARCLFLERFHHKMPLHILCYSCGVYHKRKSPGQETLRWPAGYARHPLTRCSRQDLGAPFVRMTADRGLPFALAQLATAHLRFGSPHGIPLDKLNRSWTSNGGPGSDPRHSWTHKTKFALFDSRSLREAQRGTTTRPHLIMQVTSMFRPRGALTPSAARLALSCRTDYTANYCACNHEARGASLFKVARCILTHIGDMMIAAGSTEEALPGVIPQCPECRPMFRCSLCPTEYKVSAKVVESSRKDLTQAGIAHNGRGPRFELALVVERWTDLGPCNSPFERTWHACSSKGTYSDEDTPIWRAEHGPPPTEQPPNPYAHLPLTETPPAPAPQNEFGPRRKFERALGIREFNCDSVPLRKPMHWQSKLRQDLETYFTTSTAGQRPVLGGGRHSQYP